MHASAPVRLAVLAAAALAAAAPARAQEGECREGAISEIFIDNNSVFDVGSAGLDARFNWAYRLANSMHVATRPEVVRRELLFAEGDCYSPALLEDSERILRAASFIADADVYAVPQADGSWHVVVETRDEWSTRLEPQLESAQLTGLELREDNLLGRGQRVAAFFREYQDERIFGASFGTRQLLGTQWDADLALSKTPVGYAVLQRLAYPFRGEGGRWAFRQQLAYEESNFEYFVPTLDGDDLERRRFPVESRGFEVGAFRRLGRRGHLTVLGVAVMGEWIAYPQDYLTPREGEEAPDDDPAAQPDPGIVQGLDTVSSVRAVALVGQRNLVFDRRRALDAVRGAEDVPLGIEVEVGVGRSLTAFSTDDDLSVDAGFYGARDLPGGVLAGMRGTLEAKRVFGDDDGWRNLFGQLDAWAYWRPSEESRHTLVAALSGAGGWRTTVPFQLTLGNRSGVRGLERHAFTGERRVVATLEHRAYLGWPYPELFDLGSAAFVDVGHIWAGGDAFGTSSPIQVSAGVGLRLAFPPGSRRTYRLDVAMPVSGDGTGFGGLTVSLGIGQAVGRGAVHADPQLRRSSRRALSASLFSFPP
ncbi:MAG TPA: BamA/TamA family outer membrane protein [Longimicrobiaceae bacterium]|nr:BamA/TamA family outer membrane protein [Longimicrobiaceae bacterium]